MPDIGGGAQTWDWNGRTGSGTVRNGRYVLQLVGHAGGRTFHAPSSRPTTLAQVAAFGVTVDTVAPTVRAASASTTLISPNGDGNHDAVRLAMTSSGATRWALLVASPAGTIRTAHGSGGSIAFTWRGERDSGARVADGRYTATLGVMDAAGNQARRSFTIVVDTTGPVISTAAAPGLLSPNGDGAQDATRLSWSANERGSGTVRILQGQHGRAVVDGAFGVRLGHELGRANRGRQARRRRPLRAARRPRRRRRQPACGDAHGGRGPHGGLPPLVAQLLSAGRRPARAELDPVLEAHPRREDDAPPVQRVRGRSSGPCGPGRLLHAGARQWAWNGRLANGAFAPQGRYEARLTVSSSLGTAVLVRPVWASAFAASTSATRLKAGPDAADDVHDARAARDEANGLVQAARPGGEGR